MLELNFISEHREKVIEGLERRCYPPETSEIIDSILKMNENLSNK